MEVNAFEMQRNNRILEFDMNNSTMLHMSVMYSLIWIINNLYIKYSIAHLTIGQYAANFQSRDNQNDYINMLLKHYQGINPNDFVVLERESMLQSKSKSNNQNTIRRRKNMALFFVDNLSSFSYLKQDLLNTNNYWDRSGRFTIIYTENQDNLQENLQAMFEELFKIYVLNINVIIPGEITRLYTYFPFQPYSCHSTKPQLLLEFKNLSNVPDIKYAIFPEKVKNLYGCNLFLTTWSDPPFVELEYNSTTGEIINLDGIEGSVMKLLAEGMNFSIKIKNPPDLDRGVIYENGTVTGAIKMIRNGESNISMNSYVNELARASVMSSSTSHMSCRLGVATPNGLPLKSWQRLLKPFGVYIWATLSISIILAIFIIIALKMWGQTNLIYFVFGYKNNIPFTNLLAALYGQLVTGSLPKKKFARFLLCTWLWYTFILRVAYVSKLYDILNDIRYVKPFQTLENVVTENLTFLAAAVQEQMLIETLHTNNIEVINSSIFPNLFKDIQYADARFVIVALEPTIMDYNKQEMLYGRHINMVPEVVSTYPIVFFMPNHSFLKNQIDEIINRITSAGMVSYYLQYYLYQQTSNRYKDNRASLSMTVLLDLFKIYFALLLYCILVFILELLSRRFANIRRAIDFFNI